MPEDERFSAILKFCTLETARIKYELHIFRGLYGSDPRRVEVLNRAAPEIAQLLQDLLFDDIVIRLCRLLDPPEDRRGNVNFGLRLLIALAPKDTSLELATEVEVAFDLAAKLKERRDKHIAHNDGNSKRADCAKGWVSLADIQAALDRIDDVVVRLHLTCRKVSIETDPILAREPEMALLRALHLGADALDKARDDYLQRAMHDRGHVPKPLAWLPDWLR
ncbi:AbiU2 domain-containing protein [Paracoccus sp. (in: a-proteobacteria)]|uniref:AbiU2 domain-containing protein n=1 Tax=Paracoccus sp. TaxID=267 RepID=UPI00272CE660|nr:hypothetical protein [Paracoccus sp. (in: a-proteobacteria)]